MFMGYVLVMFWRWCMGAECDYSRSEALECVYEWRENYPHDLAFADQVAALHPRTGHREIARSEGQEAGILSDQNEYQECFETLLPGQPRS